MSVRPSTCVKLTILFALAFLPADQVGRADDVRSYFVRKGLEYDQVDPIGPLLNATNGYGFEAEVDMTSYNTVSSALLQVPLQTTNQPFALSSAQIKWRIHHKYKSQSKLDSHYPTSDPLHPYVITTVGRADGGHQVRLQLQGNAGPVEPNIRNFPEATMPHPNGYFQVKWEPANDADHLQLHVQDAFGNAVFQTPDFGKEGSFDGTATGVLVGPGWLAPGQSYQADLLFVKHYALDQTSYPGALGESGFYTRTRFTITPPSNVVAPDVDAYEISKGQRWMQTNSGPPVPEAGTQYRFEASVKSYGSNVLSHGVLLLPPTTNSPSRNLLLQPGGTILSFTDSASVESVLDSFYGSTNYTLVFDTVQDGHKSLILPLPPSVFPPPPHVTNFDAIGMVDASQPFTISWDPWVGGTFDDFVQVRIEDRQNNTKFWQSPNLGKQTTLHGRSTSVVVPAGVLIPGGSYLLTVLFQRNIAQDTTTYPGVLGLSDFYSRTKIDIQTIQSDVKSYRIFKGQVFGQNDAGTPVLQASNAFQFEAQVEGSASNAVLSAAVVTAPPAAAAHTLTPQPGRLEFYFSDWLATKNALDAAYPNGTNTLNVNTSHDGNRSLPVALLQDLYPNPPHVTNYAAAQTIAPTNDFTLAWDAFVSGSDTDFIQLLVSDGGGHRLFQTPDYGMAGALSGRAVSVRLPANTLGSDQTYSAVLLFQKVGVLSSSNYPGAQGLAGYSSATRFTLATRTTVPPPVLTPAYTASNHQFQATAAVVPGVTYRLDGSSNLFQWTPLTTNMASSDTLLFIDTNAVNHRYYYYRMVVLP